MTDEPHNAVSDKPPAFHHAVVAGRVAAWLAFASAIMMGLTAMVTGAGAVTSLIVFAVPTVLAFGFQLASQHLKRESRRSLEGMVLLATLSTLWIVNNLLMVLAAIAAWVAVVQARRGRASFRSRVT